MSCEKLINSANERLLLGEYKSALSDYVEIIRLNSKLISIFRINIQICLEKCIAENDETLIYESKSADYAPKLTIIYTLDPESTSTFASLETFCGQDIKNEFEIVLLVYKNSPEHLADILIKAFNFPNVKIYNFNILKRWEAENRIISCIDSQYILFSDSNVFLKYRNSLSILLNVIDEGNYQVVAAKLLPQIKDNAKNLRLKEDFPPINIKKTNFINLSDNNLICLYRTSFIKNNKIQFKNFIMSSTVFMFESFNELKEIPVISFICAYVKLKSYNIHVGKNNKQIIKRFEQLTQILHYFNLSKGTDNPEYHNKVYYYLVRYLRSILNKVNENNFFCFIHLFFVTVTNIKYSEGLIKKFQNNEFKDLIKYMQRKDGNAIIQFFLRGYLNADLLISKLNGKIGHTYESSSLACVIIPASSSYPSKMELEALKRCLIILNNYDIYLVYPYGIDISQYKQAAKKTGKILKYKAFPNSYFHSYRAYNLSCVDSLLYEQFTQYKYLLLCQLDAWVFSDKLEKYCSCNLDYIGCPWTNGKWGTEFELAGGTAGGGFSLRKVSSFIEAIYKYNLSRILYPHINFRNFANEDVLISYIFPKTVPSFRISEPPLSINFCFSLWYHPEYLIPYCTEFPFGAHAFHKACEFYKKYINFIE